MKFVKKNVQNWRDGKRIEGYCNGYYSETDILALREIHRLHLNQTYGFNRTPQEVLETIASATPRQKQFLKFLGGHTDSKLCDVFIRLAEDQSYADRILSVYRSDVKPNLEL